MAQGLTKATVGGSNNTWGTTTNTAIDNLDSRARSLIFPTDGTTDCAPIMQAGIDAGEATFDFLSGISYLFNSAVFFDVNDAHDRYTVNGNGAKFIIGTGCPTSTWTRDTATKWCFFPNTVRAALSGGVVTVNDANRATGSGGALRTLIVRDVIVDCQAAYRGFVFTNRSGVTLENVTFYRGRCALTWWDYTDGITIINCYSRGGSGPSEQVICEGYQNGDGFLADGGKADSSVSFVRLKLCRGAVFNSLVTAPVELVDCTGVEFNGCHQEGQQSTTTMLTCQSSQVNINGGVWYENWSATVAAITIDDSNSTETGSVLTLRGVVTQQLVTTATGTTQFSPILEIVAASEHTTVKFRDVIGQHTSTGIAGHWVAGSQPYIKAITAIQTVLDSAQGRSAIAGGTFTIQRMTSGNWHISPVTGADQVYFSKRQSAAPTIIQITVSTGMTAGGTLTNGTVYAYAAACIDARGNYSTATAESTGTPNTNLMTRILLSLANAPETVILWRKTTSGVLSAPDRYCLLPVWSARTYFYDTGAYINGRPWITTSVPVPNTVSATNATQAALVLNGTVITS